MTKAPTPGPWTVDSPSADKIGPAVRTRKTHCGASLTHADATDKRRGGVLSTQSNSFEVSSGRQSASPNLALYRGGAPTKHSFPNTDP